MIKYSNPGIIHIGYMRAGSTYLRSYFSQHPDIYWTRKAWYFQLESADQVRRQKYLDFFANETAHSCFIDMYEGLSLGYVLAETPQKDYANSQNPEWSPEWALKLSSPVDGSAILPGHNELARRIKDALPDARILIVLRNQLDWLKSMYLHYISFFPPERRRFIDFLDTLEGKTTLSSACYDHTLDAYASYFGKQNIHVILLEELAQDENRVLHKLCEFLDVPFRPLDQSKANRNRGVGRLPEVKPKAINGVIRRLGFLWGRLSETTESREVVTESDKAFIRSFCAVSNYRSSIWLGRDLARWGYAV